jgi:hypothetical protein
MYSSISGLLGAQPSGIGNLAQDTTVRMAQGLIYNVVDNWWGGAELVWGRATAAIRAQGLCSMQPTFDTALQAWRYDVTEVANTANLGRSLCVAMGSFTTGQYGWFMLSGVAPVNCQAAVAAGTTFGIAAAGQGGANTAGKQVLNGIITAASTTTVIKTQCSAPVGSNQLTASNTEGWFVGIFLSGTGIAAGTTVTGIDASGRVATLSAVTTAAVGTVTGTYNNATIFYNIAHLNRPFAQGAIT